jgi:transcriptional regulator with XRE-family HTH domain
LWGTFITTKTVTEFIEKKLSNTIENRTDRYIVSHKSTIDWGKYDEPSYVDFESFSIKYIYIIDQPGTEITFDIVCDATCDLTFSGSHNDDFGRMEKWLTFHCSGDLADGLSYCKIGEPEEYLKRNREKGHLSDNLVPYMYGQRDYETAANDFLRNTGYENAICNPTRIDPAVVATKVGATVEYVHITEDCHIYGRVFMNDTDAEYYDSESHQLKNKQVKAGTIFIDPNAVKKLGEGGNNNSIIHECFHYYKYKKPFMLAKMANPELSNIEQSVKPQEIDEDSAIYWMEKQTRAITPLIQMPMPAFKTKVESLIQHWTSACPDQSALELTELIIQDLADFYGVSREAARLRMIQVGYTQAIGAFNYVDDHYVPLHGASNSNLVESNQTYTLSSVDAIFASFSSPKIFCILQDGHYIFVENHYCLFESTYVTKTEDGRYQLTPYARTHMEKCCLLFTVSFKDKKINTDNILIHSALNKDLLGNIEMNVTYDGSSLLENPEKHLAAQQEINDLKALITNDFSSSLKAIMDYRETKQSSVAIDADISQPYLSQLMNGTKKPSKEIIIKLCIALHLPYDDIAMPLLATAGYVLTSSDQDTAYQIILRLNFSSTLDECNVILSKLHCTPLERTILS